VFFPLRNVSGRAATATPATNALLDRFAFAAPDNDEEHQNCQRSGYDSNQRDVIHFFPSPFSAARPHGFCKVSGAAITFATPEPTGAAG